MSDIVLSPAQEAVLAEVEAWLSEVKRGANFGPRLWRLLEGPAGTGKTSILKKLSERYKVAYAAYTGKAANVLREKGCANATTIHRLCYRARERAVKGANGDERWTTDFVARDDKPLAEFDLVCLDECSQIDATMARDLLSYGVPILVCGDRFQLPPINGEGHFSSREPDFVLTEVHRQAAGSGILRLATDIREGRGIGDPASYGPECQVISTEEAGACEDELLGWCDVVIVGTHRMRQHFNRQYRSAAKRRGPYPEKGEQLVCLQNDHRRGLLNGGLWRVEADAVTRSHLSAEVYVKSIDDDKVSLLADCWAHDFLGTESELDKMPWNKRAQRARFAYGYALTCHKMQGSQADRVLVIDESSTFREHAARWIYTAATRAAKQLVVVR